MAIMSRLKLQHNYKNSPVIFAWNLINLRDNSERDALNIIKASFIRRKGFYSDKLKVPDTERAYPYERKTCEMITQAYENKDIIIDKKDEIALSKIHNLPECEEVHNTNILNLIELFWPIIKDKYIDTKQDADQKHGNFLIRILDELYSVNKEQVRNNKNGRKTLLNYLDEIEKEIKDNYKTPKFAEKAKEWAKDDLKYNGSYQDTFLASETLKKADFAFFNGVTENDDCTIN